MASSIGVRVYLISVHKKGDRGPLSFAASDIGVPPPQFISQFIADHSTVIQNDDRQRSWFFEEKQCDKTGSKGYVNYGTFGFESNFIDTKTKQHNYRRKVTDIEEIPLFYEFLYPTNAQHAFVIFQSFQGRSCIELVTSKITELFHRTNNNFLLAFEKIMPNDSVGSLYFNAPVKKLRLIKKNISSDIADRYFGTRPPEAINLEVSLTAKRKGNFGKFGLLKQSLKKDASGVVTHDGISFDNAIAEIEIGGRTRPVEVFGTNRNAGVIDLSNSIVRGTNGHPTFESMVKESHAILKDFHTTISGRSHEN
jgi:hypothetical protein